MPKKKPKAAIPKEHFEMAYQQIVENKVPCRLDTNSIAVFQENLENNLYMLWNRMSSGSYFPKEVTTITLEKPNGEDGKIRRMEVPVLSMEDCIARLVTIMSLEPHLEAVFHEDSYGGRPNKSFNCVKQVTETRRHEKEWAISFHVKGLINDIKHDYLLEMVKQHTTKKWIHLYIKRWLELPVQGKGEAEVTRTTGVLPDKVISPILCNLYLHHALDDYVSQHFPEVLWSRYLNKGFFHCTSQEQAEELLDKLQKRFADVGLRLAYHMVRVVHFGKDRTRKQDNSIRKVRKGKPKRDVIELMF